ncbi:MAG TPA: hypothetical protein VKG25_20430, partial [Bryobacteraceae bacterium]|nr:hypothetical protein [Bryobacteraceae bacterium]
MTPSVRLLSGSVGAIYVMKMVALALRHRPMTAAGLPFFLFAWPGVIPDSFEKRRPGQMIEAQRFFGAWARMAAGGT